MTQTLNDRLHDLVLRRAHRLARLENACVRAVLKQWKQMSREVAATIKISDLTPRLRGQVVTRAPSERVDSAVSRVTHIVQSRLTAAMQCVSDDLPDVARLELIELPQKLQAVVDHELSLDEEDTLHESHVELIEQEINVNVSFSTPPVAQAAQLLASPLGGAAFGQSFADLTASVLRSLRNTLVSGLARGLGVSSIAQNVQRVLGNKKWEAERIVRSEYVRVGNQAALLTYQQNARLLAGVRWISTLDRSTCLRCAALDGKVWKDPNKAKIPVVDTHASCRCTLSPVVKSSKELGLTRVGPSTRASVNGQVPATTTYPEWFARQPATFQREVLGPTRYALYSQGRLDIKDFSGVSGIRPVKDALRRALDPVKFAADDDFETEDEKLAEKFSRFETPSQRAQRIDRKFVSSEDAERIRKALGIPEAKTAFTPAKNLKDAVQYTRSLGIQRVSARASDLSTLNTLNEHLTRARDRGIRMPRSILVDRRADSRDGHHLVASYRALGDMLHVNPSATIDGKTKFWDDPADRMKYLGRARMFSSDQPDHVITHELGHLTHARTKSWQKIVKAEEYRISGSAFASARAQIDWLNRLETRVKDVGKSVSRYATTSAKEFVAETWAGLHAGKTYGDTVMQLYVELGGPEVGEATPTRPTTRRGEAFIKAAFQKKTPDLPALKARAYQGQVVNSKLRISGKGRFKILGDFAESIVTSYLSERASEVTKLSLKADEKANDVFAWVKKNKVAEAIEIKATEVWVLDPRWRITNGEPGEARKEKMKEMSAAAKAKANEQERLRHLKAKLDRVKKLQREYPKATIKPVTYALMIDHDRRMADLYRFEGYHLELRSKRAFQGKGPEAKTGGYISTIYYDDKIKPVSVVTREARDFDVYDDDRSMDLLFEAKTSGIGDITRLIDQDIDDWLDVWEREARAAIEKMLKQAGEAA